MQWKTIWDFPKYEVSENGDVRRVDSGVVLKPVSDRGYKLYRLYRHGKRDRPAVRGHVLVLQAFVGEKPFDDAEGCHIDGNRGHNHYTNLRWGTRAQNVADRVVHGTATYAGSYSRRTPELVAKARSLLSKGIGQAEVARQVNLSRSVVHRLANGAY